MKLLKIVIPFFLITFAVCAAHFNLFKPGIFPTEDGDKLIIRFASFHQALSDGQLPPRWAGNLFHGFGYPVFIFLYPGLLFFWEVLRLMTGLSFIASVKAGLLLSLVVSGFGMFFFLREFFGKLESAIGGLIYPILPYVFFDLYMRGSFGEVTSFALVPLIFLAVNRFFKRKSFIWILIGSLFWAALLVVHNVTGILFSALLVIYICGLLIKSHKFLVLFMPLLAILIDSFFLLPAFFERSYTKFYQTSVADPAGYFLNSSSLFMGPYHYGVLYSFILIVGLLTVFLTRKHKSILLFLITSSLVSLFFSLEISQPLWNLLSLSTYVQFPYRFLSLVTFSAPFILISFLDFLKNKYVSVFLAITFLAFSFVFYRPQVNEIKPDNYYFTNLDPTTSANEYLPKDVKSIPPNMPKNKIEAIGTYRILEQKSNLLKAEINSQSLQTVKINTFYYPGWKLYINNESRPIIVDNKTGVISFNLDKNIFRIKLVFEKTVLRMVSEIISLGSLFVLIILIYVNKKIKH